MNQFFSVIVTALYLSPNPGSRTNREVMFRGVLAYRERESRRRFIHAVYPGRALRPRASSYSRVSPSRLTG